jgi:YtkA-like
MKLPTSRALCAALMLAATTSSVLADIKDYEFRLLQNEVKKGDGAIVSVKLTNKRTGQPISGAVIFAKRIDMAPDNMAEMASSIELLPSTEPGVYRFKTNLSMEGRWRLSIGAKVQGETGSVDQKLQLKATP